MRILLTGHTGGLGKLLHKLLEQKGHEVIGVSLSTGFDLTKDDAFCRIADHVRQPVDIVVHNAGVLSFGGCKDFKLRDIVEVAVVNAFAPMLLSRELLRRDLIRDSIFCILSYDIYDHPQNQILYNCSKAWAAEWLVSAARELAREGIRVNGLALGLVDTGMYHVCVAANAFDPTLPIEPMPAEAAADFAVDCILTEERTGEIWKLPSFR